MFSKLYSIAIIKITFFINLFIEVAGTLYLIIPKGFIRGNINRPIYLYIV